jgi:hypothetical protein
LIDYITTLGVLMKILESVNFINIVQSFSFAFTSPGYVQEREHGGIECNVYQSVKPSVESVAKIIYFWTSDLRLNKPYRPPFVC